MHEVQPGGAVFGDSGGPKAFRISAGQRAVPAEDQDGAREGCLTQGKVQFRVSVAKVEARYLETGIFWMLSVNFPTY